MANEFRIKNGLIVDQGTSQISGSLNISGSTIISGSLNVTQGITGSLFGTSSWAQNATSASFASTASFVNPLRQTVQVTGSLNITGSSDITGPLNVTNTSGPGISMTATTVGRLTYQGQRSVDWTSRVLQRSNNNISLNWENSTLNDANEATVLSWANGLTGSIFGTSSYATLSATASFVTGSNVFGPFGSNSITSASFAVSSSRAVSSSFASTASFVNTLNQSVLITGSLTVGTGSLGPSENTITLGARDSGGEGGQLGFNASGGTYTSASMIDLYQNRLRILRGTNAGSDAEVAWWSMHNKQMALPAYNSVSAFAGTATALLAVDTSGNVITVATGSGGGGSGTVTNVATAGTVNGITLTGGPITTTGTITLGGTLSNIQSSQLATSSLMIGNSSISLGATASSLTGLTSVTATSFLGTASWANNATNAVNVGITDNPSSGGGPFYIPFVAAATGNAAIQVDSSTFLYAPSTNTITVTNLAGTASNATNVAVTDTTTGTGPYYLMFADGTTGNRAVRVDSSTLTFNATTNTFTVPIVNSSTAVQGGNGSVSAPAFSFSGDTDTGMYNAGANIIGFAQGGQAMAIMSASGFHMNSSGTKTFEIGAGSAGDTNLVFSPNTTGGTGGNINVNHPSLPLIFKLNSTERARITTAGNVGIGTTTPTSRLTVDDSTAFSWGFPSSASAKIGTPGTGGSFMVMTPSLNSSYESGFAVDGTYTSGKSVINLSAFGVYSGGPYSADIAFKTATNTTLSEKMRITNDGNVGIGTTSPSQKLHVSGSARIEGAIYDSSNSAGTSGQVLSSTGTGTSWITSGGGSAFPYTGSALITGSLGITGSLSTTGSDAFINGVRVGRGKGNIITNTAVGTGSLFSITTGPENTAVGQNTLRSTTTGGYNTAVGSEALVSNAGGGYNVAVGRRALYNNSAGNANTAVGYGAGASSTGDNNIIIGFGLDSKPDNTGFNGSYTLSIGKDSTDIQGYPHIWAPETVTISTSTNTTILTVDPSTYSGFFLEYVFDDTNGLMRSGTIKAVFTSTMSSIQWSEVDMLSIGTTSAAVFSVVDNGSSQIDVKLDNTTGVTLYLNFTSRLLLRQL